MSRKKPNWERLYAQYRLFGATIANLHDLRVLERKDDAWSANVTDVLTDRQLDVLLDVLESEGLR